MSLHEDVPNESSHQAGDKADRANEQRPCRMGYGNPPVSTRFRKGRSGNPKGRPKARKTMKSAIERVLNEKAWTNENGRRKYISKREVWAKQLVNRAAAGEVKFVRLLLDFYRQERLEVFKNYQEQQQPEIDLQLPEDLSVHERAAELANRLRARIEARRAIKEKNENWNLKEL
jgi:hypothetical protein